MIFTNVVNPPTTEIQSKQWHRNKPLGEWHWINSCNITGSSEIDPSVYRTIISDTVNIHTQKFQIYWRLSSCIQLFTQDLLKTYCAFSRKKEYSDEKDWLGLCLMELGSSVGDNHFRNKEIYDKTWCRVTAMK